jgi:dTMP kinase
MFITLEGPEGSGKSSQIPPLKQFLCEQGYDVLATREPGGTSVGEQIRTVLFNLENTDILPRTEILLFQAARAQLVDQVIRPHLAKGGVVLCDRYADSTLAYQGYGYRRNIAEVRAVIEFATGGLWPELTLLLDVDVQKGLERRNKEGGVNRLDTFSLAFYERVREGYLDLARQEPQRWVRVDAGQPPARVQEEVREVVLRRLQGESTSRHS